MQYLYRSNVVHMLREYDHSNMLFGEFTQSAPLIAELSAYLRKPKIVYKTDNRDFERLTYLNEFPIIKQLYLKYNCIFATEADVERVFSYAGRIFVDFFVYLCCCLCSFVFFSSLFTIWV